MSEQCPIKSGTPPQFPFEREFAAPPAEYTFLRQTEPFKKVRLWDGSHAWLVTRNDDVREILRDTRFSIDPLRDGFPNVSEARKSVLQGEKPTFIRMDAPEHMALRGMLTKEFVQTRINEMRPQVQRIVDHVLSTMIEKGSPADFHDSFAMAVPSMVISELLGVPYKDHEFFQDCTRRKIDLSADPSVPIEASKQLRGYLDELLAAKEKDPNTDDMLGRLVVEQIRPGRLDREEAVRMAELLLIAGHETTGSMITLGALSLLLDRAQFDLLRNDPSLAPQAVEEMLRFHTHVQLAAPRVAVEDVEINGHMIRAGEGVLPMINAANRDPARHPDPDIFDINKPRTPHVAFGFGAHQCLGQTLARLELDVIFSTLLNRLPTLELAVPFEEIPFKKKMMVFSVYALPVRW